MIFGSSYKQTVSPLAVKDLTKVYLVGSGPGPANLLTCRAATLLAQADAIVYDALIDKSIHKLFAPKAKCIYVGKRAGEHSLKQDEINELLIRTTEEIGGCIVRLKGGDPFVFGRGGEEMIALKERGIPYEIIPGITAGIASPAYFGIPVTHRKVSRSVTLATAFTEGEELPDLDWDAYARLGGTLVFYMGMRVVPEIALKLIEAGLPPTYRAAIIHFGTRPNQHLELHDLAYFTPGKLDYARLTPGLFVVGDVLAFAEEHQWCHPHRLSGKKILITRSEGQSSALVALLEEADAEATVLPCFEIEHINALEDASSSILEDKYDLLALSSPNAVHSFISYILALGMDIRYLSRFKDIAVVGPATAEALRSYGIVPDLIAREYTAEGLAESIATECTPHSVLHPTSDIAGDRLASLLKSRGIEQVKTLVTYKNKPMPYTREELEAILCSGLDWVTFCSSSAVTNFLNLVKQHNLCHLLSSLKFAVIGPTTAQTLLAHGLAVSAQPPKPSLEALVASLY